MCQFPFLSYRIEKKSIILISYHVFEKKIFSRTYYESRNKSIMNQITAHHFVFLKYFLNVEPILSSHF